MFVKRTKSAVAIDDFLSPWAWWYAPAASTLIAGFTLWGQNANWLAAAAGLLAAATVLVHYSRTRTVQPKTSLTGIALTILTTVLSLVILGLWTSVASTAGDNFAPWYAALLWVATTAFFLAMRTGSGIIRRHRGPVV